jgi:RNAse (barnase) inhibitor barstar
LAGYIFATVIINNLKLDDMKTTRIFFSLILVALTVLATNSYASSNEAFNDNYKISTVDVAAQNADAAKCWDIVYGDSNRPVKVFLKETKKGDEYIVRTNYFEVKYVNGAKGFGVRELSGSEQRVPADLNYKVINLNNLNNQKIISGTKVADNDVLEMIASFLPELVNEQYKTILN